MGFSGKTVLVTGASGSIGQAIVRHFADGGALVAVHYHAGHEAAEELISTLPGRATSRSARTSPTARASSGWSKRWWKPSAGLTFW